MNIQELDIQVSGVAEFNEKATDILQDYCDELFDKPNMIRWPNEEEIEQNAGDDTFFWTKEAMQLINAEKARLIGIGGRYFHFGLIVIENDRVLED